MKTKTMKTKTTKTGKQMEQPKTSPEMDEDDGTLIVCLPTPPIEAVQRVAELLGNDFTGGKLLDVLNKQLDFLEWANDRAEEAGARK